MLNPRNLYDLLFFDSNKGTLSKRYEFDPGEEDFVWSNSLVIDEAADRFYGLTFPKHQYNANLQLVAGSLSQPDIKKLGGHIPYLFHDRSEEHTSELQSLMRISYAVFCLKKKKTTKKQS